MYLKKIELKNIGPIDHIKYELPFHGENPMPVVLVGVNGSGKSIFMSYIVDAMMSAKGAVFNDIEVEQGKVYKLRSPKYIKNGEQYYGSTLTFTNGFYQTEIQLQRTKEKTKLSKDELGYQEWSKIKDHEYSYYDNNFLNDKINLKKDLEKTLLLYYPPNRFEEPPWLNRDNLLNHAKYLPSKEIEGFSNRSVINYSPLKENEFWLLDLLYDRFVLERKSQLATTNNTTVMFSVDLNGPATKTLKMIEYFFKKALSVNQVTWNVGARGRRKISITTEIDVEIRNLFSLSTGQTALLNIFLTIIRHADLLKEPVPSLEEIKGIVVIDEVDLHLHSDLQSDVLPELINLFPKIQFILTTHSPLFLLGMDKKLGKERFEIISLPSGLKTDIEKFSEFESAYQYFKGSTAFEQDVAARLKESQKNILFVEGPTDEDYITKAAKLLEEQGLLDSFDIVVAKGNKKLDGIWTHYGKWLELIPMGQKFVLLYDCDSKSRDEHKKDIIYRRTLPEQSNPVKKGIENLFNKDTLERANNAKNFIDITGEHEKRERGELKKIPEKWEVNESEKSNLCKWLLDNGIKKDFENFKEIFQILRKILD